MKEFFFNTIQEFNDYIGVKTLHPLVSIARVAVSYTHLTLPTIYSV